MSVPLQSIVDGITTANRIDLSVLRLDLLHASGAGNKLFKLKDNFIEAKRQQCLQLLSYGGAYSNHIHALAIFGAAQGFRTIGVIRGERPKALSDTLVDAEAAGMHLHFVTRSAYRQRSTEVFEQSLRAEFGDSFIIPEGGANTHGVSGCEEIASLLLEQVKDVDVVALAAGTGATAAGVCAGLKNVASLSCYAVVRDLNNIEQAIQSHVGRGSTAHWVVKDASLGAYAKLNEKLASFIRDFQVFHNIPLEPIYTGKLFLGIYEDIMSGYYPPNTKIVAIHTGGLQGNRGMDKKMAKLIASSHCHFTTRLPFSYP